MTMLLWNQIRRALLSKQTQFTLKKSQVKKYFARFDDCRGQACMKWLVMQPSGHECVTGLPIRSTRRSTFKVALNNPFSSQLKLASPTEFFHSGKTSRVCSIKRPLSEVKRPWSIFIAIVKHFHRQLSIPLSTQSNRKSGEWAWKN